jgi:TonB family protein
LTIRISIAARAVVFAASIFIALFAGSAARAGAAESPTGECPYVTLRPSADGQSYVIRIASSTPAVVLPTFDGEKRVFTLGSALNASAGIVSFQVPKPASDTLRGATFAFERPTTCVAYAAVSPDPPFVTPAFDAATIAVPTPLALTDAGPQTPIDCARAYGPAAVSGGPPVVYPPALRGAGTSGTAFVFVAVGPGGAVLGERLAASSHSDALDRAALAAAAQSTYDPAYYRCKPVAGTAIYRADFGSS